MNNKQLKFAEQYLILTNATLAYQAAYVGSSKATAEVNGHKLLNNAKIAAFIKEKQDEIIKKNIITKEQILMDLKIIVNLNLYERPAIAIKAYDLAVKMLGYNQPIETMVTIKGEQPLFGPLND
jgi:hypothetical protein